MTDWEPHLLLELETERTSSRRRETFLLSVIAHLLIVLLVITQPDLFRRALEEVGVSQPRPQDVTLLYQPPDLPEVETPPDTPVLSDRDRRAQPGVEEPPPPLEYRPPVLPPLPPSFLERELEERAMGELPEIGLPEFPEASPEASDDQPDEGQQAALEPVQPPETAPPPTEAKLTLLQIVPPSRGTDAILKGMAKERASGRGGQSFQGGFPSTGPQNPNLYIPGPQILSDTMGVDFHPYLLRMLTLVRRNWYAVIPEIARLGRQGRVVLQFSILRDGSVPDLILAEGSGTRSLDSAALVSIRLSNPFPALPQKFPGDDIRMQFTYLYNLPVQY
ncbi:MAG: TonB family protein [Acidobacteria bacterium]|nr:TonB family protein [Acidobacteriota bacterium]